jgi:hypothetical protein
MSSFLALMQLDYVKPTTEIVEMSEESFLIFFRLLLTTLKSDLAADTASLPFILHRIDKDGTVAKGPPGYQVEQAEWLCYNCNWF